MSYQRQDISGLRKNRNIHFQIGLIIALGLAYFAINYTFTEAPLKKVEIHEGEDDDLLVEPIRTTQEKKKLPPPPEIEINDKIDEIDEPEFEPEPTPEPVVNSTPEPKVNPIPNPTPNPGPPKKPAKKVEQPKPPVVKPPAPPEPVDDGPVTIAERMPVFGSECEGLSTEKERKQCSDKALITWVQKNVRYPRVAQENDIEGMAVVQFIVEKDGSITDIKVVKAPAGGCKEEALRVVKKMPKWASSGKQNGRKVRVKYTLPIRFQLAKR